MRISRTLPRLAAITAAGLIAAGVAHAGGADPGTRAERRAQFQQTMLEQLDTDHDGLVSRAEYQAWVDARFDRLDANRDGQVDANEVATSQASADRARKRAERFLAHYDASGSGVVTRADFEAKAMARFDRVGGGSDTVTAEQLMPHRGGRGRRHDADASEG